MDACSDPSIQEVVVMAGAQLGKTEALLKASLHLGEDTSQGAAKHISIKDHEGIEFMIPSP